MYRSHPGTTLCHVVVDNPAPGLCFSLSLTHSWRLIIPKPVPVPDMQCSRGFLALTGEPVPQHHHAAHNSPLPTFRRLLAFAQTGACQGKTKGGGSSHVAGAWAISSYPWSRRAYETKSTDANLPASGRERPSTTANGNVCSVTPRTGLRPARRQVGIFGTVREQKRRRSTCLCAAFILS